MWTVLVARDAAKVADKLQPAVAEKLGFWIAIVRESGPQVLRTVKSFHDEKLAGKLAGKRASRLSLQWRVIYSVREDVVTVTIEQITPHVYRP